MTISPQRDILTKMLLVACDQSYQPGPGSNAPPAGGVTAKANDPLSPFPDNEPKVEVDFANQMPVQWRNLQMDDGTHFSDWRIDRRFDDRDTGFGATVFRRDIGDGKQDYIVALQGTRGPNVQDWSGNLIYGWDKWSTNSARNAEEGGLTSYLLTLGQINKIHFTGQSLGGALAQYAVYDFYAAKKLANDQNAAVEGFAPFLESQMTLTTFNGLGGVEALTQNYNGQNNRPQFVPSLLSRVDTAHFVTDNDVVNRLGTANLNGSGNEYLLRTVRVNKDTGAPVLRSNEIAVKVFPFPEIHRVETGFYYTFNWAARNPANRMPADFTKAEPRAIYHLNIAGLAKVGTAIAWTSNKDGVNLTNSESYARLTAALLASAAFGPKERFGDLVRSLMQHVGAAAPTESVELAVRGFGEWLAKFLNFYAKTPSGLSAQGGALLAAALIEGMNSLATKESSGAGRVNIEPDVSALMNGMTAGAPAGTGNFDLKAAQAASRQILLGSTGDKTQSYLFAISMVGFTALTLLPSLGISVGAATADTMVDLVRAFANDPKGLIKALAEFSVTLVRDTGAPQWTAEKARKVADALAQLSAAAVEQARNAARGAAATVQEADAFYGEVVQGTSVAMERVANSISNNYKDLIVKRNNAFEWGVNVSREALDVTVKAFSSTATTVSETIRSAFDRALGALRSAGEIIFIRTGTGVTPFNADFFVPETAPTASAVIPERGSKVLTLYLPYPAGEGGQKILLTAVGPSNDKLVLNAGTEVPNVNGTFAVTVPEGARQLVLAFGEVGDIDEDSTLDIKAQLVDASGNPTHKEHLELTLTLDGEAEVEIAEAPGSTSVTVLGDQRYKEFTDVVEATGGPAGIGFIPDVPRGPFEVHDWTNPGFVPPADWVNLDITDATYQIDGSSFDDETGITTTYFTITQYVVLHNSLDELGNVITDAIPEPDRPERLFGSEGADLIDARGGDDNVEAKDGDDTVYAGSGNDDVEAGAGNDWVDGGSELDFINGDAGNDRLIGSAGVDLLSGDVSRAYILTRGFTPDASTALEGEDVLEGGLGGMDMLLGGGGKDQLFAKVVQDRDVAISEGEASGASGERGDWLAGGGGDDLVVGAQDNEALFGGSGSDLLIAGAGDDHINADQSYVNEYYDWNITETITTVGIETLYTYHYGFVFSDGDAEGEGADRIYAGAGNDVVLAGAGEDFVDAGSGTDKVWGEAGGDIIIGGAGDDILNGDNSTSQLAASQHGDDFLDGGEGNDRLLGDGGNDALYGGDGDDFLQGDTIGVVGGDDYLNGEAGNDTLSGTGGADVLVGGAGNDELFGDSDDTPLEEQGADELVGGEGDDWLQGYGGDDMLDGGSGLDELYGGADADTLLGGDGNDRLFGEDGTGVGIGGDDTIVGGLGDDEIRGEGGSDTIDGGGGADVIGGDAGNDTIFGGLGADQLVGGEDNDILRGDGGNDIILGEAGADDIEGGTGDDNIEGGDDADRIAGGEGDDTLQGGSGSDVLFGNENRDLLFGAGGEDILDGGAGNDHLQGGAGFDTYIWDFGSDEDTVFDVGNNAVRFGAGISGDFLSLGIGSLLIRVAGENALHIEGFDAQNPYADIGISELQFTDFDGNVVDTMTWNELIDLGFDLVGTPDADYISGTDAADRIYGLEEQDVLFGRGDDDTIYGGEGGDSIFAEDGNDTLFGDAGNDVLNLGEGDDVAEGGEGDDSIYGEAGDDLLAGGIGGDGLDGGEGADSLDGGIGDDALYGAAGDDVLTGGEGNDFLQGGDGADVLAGGLGDDTYFLDDDLDLYTENAGEGDDTIVATFDYALGEQFENLELAAGSAAISGTGSAVDNYLQGNENDNLLFGLEGDDALFGGDGNDALDGGTGNDFMLGGFGDDTFLVDSEDDVVEEQYDLYHREYLFDDFGNALSYGFLEASGGYDTVEASVSFALDQWTEALVLTGSDAIDGTGNVEWNYLQGNDAENTLYAYRLNGEADTYPSIGIIVQQFTNPRDAAEEMLQDKANVAIYRAEFPWFLPQQVDLYAGAGDDLVGLGGNDRLFGGLDNDYLYGGDGDDLLYGFAGSDTMAGGAGDDTYVVSGAYSFRFNYVGGEYVSYEDEGTDDLFEAENEGIDTVYSEVDFALPEHFENLTLIFDTRDFDPDVQISRQRFGHMAARVGEGNALANVITANDAGNELYGYEGNDTLTGGAGNDYLAGGVGADIMRGGLGNDEYDVNEAGDQVIEMAGGGHDAVYAQIDYTLTDNVEDLYLGGETYTENLSGTGNELGNYIEGNDGNNVLLGLGGDDVLDGGWGDDAMDGGAGDDTYYVDSELDVTTEAADEGHDTVYSSVGHTLGDALDDLYLTEFDDIWGEGNALANLIVGNEGGNYIAGFEGDDVLRGEGGWDTLEGGEGNDQLEGSVGGDTLTGGEGNDVLDGGYDDDYMAGGLDDDVYYVDSDYDVVLEEAGQGTDTVFERVWYFQMGEHIENAVMEGDFQDVDNIAGYSIEGNALDNAITGNDNGNWLAGNDGHDTIDGRARNDNISGGLGDDTLYGGDDAIRYAPQYMDSYGNIYSWDYGGLKPLGISRGELASNSDELDGGAGNDTIDGGSGDDRLYGEEGDDVLYGGDDGLIADSAEFGGGNEEEGGGTDETDDGKVFLTNNDYLEGGDGDDELDGGSGNDRLLGEDGDDTLLGGADGPLNRDNDDYLDGGAGIDFMAGGTGSDRYVVDGFFVEMTDLEVYDDCGDLIPGAVTRIWTTDTVLENADEGYDSVFSYADFTLPENVEQLDLAWYSDARIGRGNASDNLIFGNDLDNRLEGGAGNDELYGSYGNDVLDGGAGDDTLVGEAGDDVYNFGAGYGHDTVYSYGGGFDTIHLVQDIAASELTLTRQGNDVVIGLAGSGDRMVLASWFGTTDHVRQIVFCDDPAWDEATIAALANSRTDPVSADDDFALVVEDALLVASGNVLGNDLTTDASLQVSNPGTYAGAYGTLELAADGSFAYTLDNDAAQVQSLAQGEALQEYFGYEAVGDFGAYADAALIVEVAGANDAPVFGPGTTGTVVEDAGELIRYADGSLLYNGVFDFGLYDWALEGNADYSGWDYLAREGWTAAYFGAIGSPALLSQDVEVFEGGRYLLEFDLLGGAPDGAEFSVSWNGATLLSVNDTGLEDEYRHYQVELDGVEGISRLEFSLRNDPGYWHLDDVRLGLLVEFENPPEFQQTSGALGFSDVDYSDWHVLSVQPRDETPLGSFDAAITSDSAYGEAGSVAWNFSVANGDLQFLAEGETLEQVYDLTIADDFGGTDTKSVTVTLRGVNDDPEISDDFAGVQEDGDLVAVGGVLDNDFDIDARDVLSVVAPGTYAGAYGTLELSANGGYAYTLANDSLVVQSLNAGEFVEDAFAFEVTDGTAVLASGLFVEVAGANDAPVAADDAASVQEDGTLLAAGNVLANDVDVDSESFLNVTNPGTYVGIYGTLALEEDGSYSYALDNAAAQSLAAGQAVREVFSYDVTDGMETSSAALTVTVAGANDTPVAEHLAATVDEDGPAGTLVPVYGEVDLSDTLVVAVGTFGNTGFELGSFAGWMLSDAALGEVVSSSAPLGERYASLRSGAGQDTYTTLARNFTLAAGETLSGLAEFAAGDALPYDDDGYVMIGLLGGASTLLFSASVAGVGDYGDTGWVPFEFVAPEAGTYVLAAGVRNTQDNSVDSRLLLDGIEQFRPALGVTQNADGTFDYDPGGRFEWLAEGEFATDTFSYTVTDDHGAQAVAMATVQIAGANDAPEIGAAATEASVTEDNALPAAAALGAQGAIAFGDVDLSDVHEVQVGTLDSGYLGAFRAQLVADSTGGGAGGVQWSFSVDNGALDALGEGETLVQYYEVLVDDGHGGTDERIVTVTLNGVNDAPVALDDVADVQEDGTLFATGNVLANDSDADAHDLLNVADPRAYVGNYGTLMLAVDGNYRYTLDNDAAQSLAAGQEFQEVFAYDATDGHVTSSAKLTVSIAGANDAPVGVNDAANVQEDTLLTATGNVLGNDSDIDANSFLNVANPGTYTRSYGTLTLLADGSYSYALDNDAAQSLAAGQEIEETFGYEATDGIARAAATLTVTIAGANDAPVTEDDAASVQEDGVTTASGNVLANDSDVDSGTTLTVADAGLYGRLDLSANGEYTYTLDNASSAVQGLRAGVVVPDSFAYLASDGLESTPGTLTVSVAGTNDNPFAQNDAGAAQEDGGPVTLSGAALLANDTDADAGDTKTLVAVTNSVAGAQVTLVGGNAVYNIGGVFQTLKAGATAADSFSYTMVDAVGAASTATVAMTITGVNDAPVLVAPIADQNTAAGTAFSFVFAPNTFTDIDIGDTLAYSASLADGTLLPSWLAFDAATRGFSGTPPGGTGGGTADDCGCGTDGGGAPETLQIRVTATDTALAGANDVFVLNIAGGSSGGGIVPILGTDHDDVIAGTSGNDIIDGRKGYDKMSGGAGDDVYFVDRSGSRVDLVVEGAVAGYDTVYSSASYTLPSNVEELHLIGREDLEGRGNALANMLIGNAGDNRLYGLAGNDLLLDDAGRDLLDGGDGDDVLDGGAGNDALVGGKGNDLFVHAKGGGHDLVQDSGGQDAIRFGYGIAAADVMVRRTGDDLLLVLSDGNGSVAVKDWFSSSSKRVEQVQFADGTVWNESAIRARVTSGADGEQGGYAGYYDDGQSGCDSGERSDGHDGDRDDDHDGGHDEDGEGGGLFDAIAARLKRSPDYDFTALAVYLQRQGGGAYGAMTPEQIAQRWVQVQNCVGSLSQTDGDCGDGYGGKGSYGGYGCDDDRTQGGWGYSGSTGQSSGCGGMGTFSGLGEGFQKL